MSFKAKNLTYEKSEPAFLRRLRNQYGDGTGERHGRSNVRPVKARDVADDEPTYVDEESNEVISKEDYDAMLNGTALGPASWKEMGADDAHGSNSGQEGQNSAAKAPRNTHSEKVAEIGSLRKKKLARVIVDEEHAGKADAQEHDIKPPKKKQKKKAIKLSFDEETAT
ncbi:hypothetical protein LOZ58_005106 [Ophidiomyces ophidiicola]|nr:hypothetical protein LOZ65_005032 [Ophidiomyces ophidiicola]KAI1935225.1 hypothetical protein LOZ66_005355 [Ophidiomyces ophidiicola]KAI1958374.1 hypothetical protein LOZ58_005106 [Ophidiomyces ophidiicola]